MITYIKGLENSGPFKKGNNACGVKVLCCSCVQIVIFCHENII